MKLLTHIPSWLKSKYFISLAVFLAIMFFFDKNDVLTQLNRRKELKDLQRSREYFTTRIQTERKELEQLKTNPATLEKYAREKYLMKRDNEDIFIIPEKKETQKN
jgi:cell division protein FtsB